ncbi:MAG: hypothetical protein MUP21_00085 [Dehalococcoidia bacterium]|nr:hypothetical protein [Dehalococcoidia bacterium]
MADDQQKIAFLGGFMKRLVSRGKPLQSIIKGSGKARKMGPGKRGTRIPKDNAVPPGFAAGTSSPNAQRTWNAYREKAMHSGGGADSLLLYPVQWAAEKALGKERVRNRMWKAVGAPALRADTAIGRVLEKTPLIGKKLFRVKEQVPWGKGLHREVERSSALGPLTKARDIAAPIIVGAGLETGVRAMTKKKDSEGDQPKDDQHIREKVASVMLHLHEENRGHEKRADALRLLYKQVELGYGQLPQSFGELNEKLAALVKEDLGVLEKALELAGGNLKFGELGSKDHSAAGSAAEKFQASLLD